MGNSFILWFSFRALAVVCAGKREIHTGTLIGFLFVKGFA